MFISPSVVDLRKTLIILITVIFTSAILSSSMSVLISLDNFDQYLYGDQDNVLVIYDTQAQTPFTSRIPVSYDVILNQLEGVEFTSPESMIPGVIDGEPLLLRGANITSFKRLHKLEMIDGEPLESSDSSSVVIGKSIAEQLDISTGDEIIFMSSLRDNPVLLRIKGIFSAESALNGEILGTLTLSQKLARRPGEYNHIKVKFNPSVTSRSIILNRIENFYEVRVLLENKAGELVQNWQLNVYDWENDLIRTQNISYSSTIDLPFGEFTFEVKLGDQVISREKRFVSRDTEFKFFTGLVVHSVGLTTLLQSDPQSMQFEVINSSQLIQMSQWTNVTGQAEIELAEGKYEFRVYHNLEFMSWDVEITDATELVLNYTDIVYAVEFTDLRDGGTVDAIDGLFAISKFPTDQQVEIKVNGTNLVFNGAGLIYSLTEGYYEMNVIVDQILQDRIGFTVDPLYEPFTRNFSDFAHFSPDDVIFLDAGGISRGRNVEFNGLEPKNYWFDENKLAVELPDLVGTYNISITAYTLRGFPISVSIPLIIETDAALAGAINDRHWYSNSTKRMWWNANINSISLNGSDLSINGTSVQIPVLVSGSYNLSIVTKAGSVSRMITIMDTPRQIIEVNNGNTLYSLSDIDSWNESRISISFPEGYYSVYANFSNQIYEVASNQTLPSFTSEYLSSIIVVDIIDKNSWDLNITINAAPQQVELITGNPQHQLLPKGQIYFEDGLEYSFTLQESYMDEEVQIRQEDSYTILYPGRWVVAISNGSISTTWELEVPRWESIEHFSQEEIIHSRFGSFTAQVYHLAGGLIHYSSLSKSYWDYTEEILCGPTIFEEETASLCLSEQYFISSVRYHYHNGTTAQMEGIFEVTGDGKLNASLYSFFGETVLFEQSILLDQSRITSSILADGIFDIITVSNPASHEQVQLTDFSTPPTISLLGGMWEITISSPYYFSQFSLGSKTAIEIPQFLNISSVLITNQNTNITEGFSGLISLQYQDGSVQRIRGSYLEDFQIRPAYVNISTNHPFASVSSPISIYQEEVVLILTPVLDSGFIEIANDLGVDPASVVLTHEYLMASQTLIKTSRGWYVDNFPIGRVQLSLSRLGRDFTLSGWFEPNSTELVFSLTSTEDVSIDKFLALRSNISGDLASEFFNQELSGPFAFFRITLITETLVILFLLLVNISGVYAGLATEARYEIRTLINLGYTKLQVVTALLRDTFKFSVFITLLGNVIGLGLSDFLLSSNSTILFGHRFVPQFPPSLWVLNLILIHLLAIAGAYIGLSLEETSIRSSETGS